MWLDNDATTGALRASVMRLWHERLEPFEANVRHGIRSRLAHPTISAPDPTWPAQADRLLDRVRHAVGDTATSLDHIGSTAVPGLVAKDVVDLQVGVASLGDADAPAFVEAMAAAGFVRPGGGLERPRHGRLGVAQAVPRLVRPRAGGPRARPRGRVARLALGTALP